MKIIFVIDSLQHGGAERVVCNLSNGLSKLGHDLSIVVLSDFKTYSFYPLSNKVKILSILKNNNEKLSRLKKIVRLRKIVANNPNAIFISFLPHVCIYTYFAFLFKKPRYIVSERSNPERYSFVYKILSKVAFKRASGCVFQSHNSMNFYFKKNIEKCAIIINPVELNVDDKSKSGETQKTIFTVGRLMKEKNIPLLIEAFDIFFKKHSDFSLEIYGDGPLKNDFIKLLEKKSCNHNVFFKGVSNKWHSECLNYACYVCSSDYEGMSNSLEEAACLGIPCVSTNCPSGGNAELLNYGEFGLLVPVGDAISLSEAIEKTIVNKLSYDYKKLLSNCSLDKISKEWEKIIIKCFDNN